MNDLYELDKKYFIHPTSSIKDQQKYGPKVIMESGEGIYLKDVEGKSYIDAISSLWNVNIGHGRKELAEVAKQQIEKLAFSSAFGSLSHEPAIRLAEKVAEIAPSNLNAVFFTSGGSESNDTAFKLARYYWQLKDEPNKKKIISLKRAYHGVAAASTSATGISNFWTMGGILDDFLHVETPYNIDTDAAIQSVKEVIEREDPGTIAAFIAEPIQGAGGVIIPDEDYFPKIRKLCDEYNILFIADEVITGFGRTGTMFASERWGVQPDLMSIAKGITSGYIPLGGVVVSDEIHHVFKTLSAGVMFHGFTYSGHPVATAVGLKNIELMEKENLVQNSREMGHLLYDGLKAIENEINIVGNVRGRGLLAAIELLEDPLENKQFNSELFVAQRVVEDLFEKGLITRAIMYEGTNIICFAPPLIINEHQIQTILDMLHESILKVKQDI